MNRSQETTSCAEKKGTLPRQLGLALVLGLLSVILFIVTADAYVAKKVETTLDDFDSGTFVYTGLLDIPQDDIDSVQLLPIGLTGDWYTSIYPLPLRLTDLAAVANGNMLYVVGGMDQAVVVHKEVYASEMSLEGELTTDWQPQTSLPEARAAAAVAIQPLDEDTSMLYVVGGYDSSFFPVDTVYRAPIDHATGQVGTWVLDAQHLPTATDYASVVVHDNALYVIGGEGMAGVFDQVNYATINADGSLNAFVPATHSLQEPVYDAVAIVYEGDGDTLYLIGGRKEFTSTFKVYFADFQSGGDLSTWTLSDGNLPNHIFGHDGLLLSGEIILTGGQVDSVSPGVGISNTIQAALIDPDNATFRLYDWCQGEPGCTIGAWQTGGLLPEVRSSHASARNRGYLYVMGGVDETQDPKNTVYYGSVSGVGALYSPEGYYRSNEMDLGQLARLRRIDWDTTINFPDDMGLNLEYRYSANGSSWSGWSTPEGASHGTNQILLDQPNVRFVQYRANFTTNVTYASPLLNWVEIYYEVADPELEVRKDTGETISVTIDNELEYTIYYTNNGGWVAENVVLSETLPEHTEYVDTSGSGGPVWQQIESSDVYTHKVGNLGRGQTDDTTFRVHVKEDVPKGTLYITDYVEIDYPPMIDAFDQIITDPITPNNSFEFGNPFLPYAITVTKDLTTENEGFVYLGEEITYSLTFSNEVRAVAATNAFVSDTVPEHTTYVPGSIFGPGADDSNAPVLRWDLATLAPGQRDKVGFLVQVDDDDSLVGTVISNAGTIDSDVGPEKVSNVVTITVLKPEYNVWTTKYAIPPSGSWVKPGELITYTIRYTNSGAVPTSEAVLSDTFDFCESYTILSQDPAPSVGDNVWYLGPLAPGNKDSIQIVVQLKDPLPSNWIVSNQASIDSPEGNPWHAPEVTHVVTNDPLEVLLPDFVIKDFRLVPSNPQPGEPVDFYVDISNEGDAPAGVGDEHFWISLYIKPSPSDPPQGPWDHDMGYCLAGCTIIRDYYLGYVGELLQGESKEISFLDDRLVFPAAGTYDVYVQLDVAFDDPIYNPYWGAYAEKDEYNNLTHRIVLITEDGPETAYLPAIFKESP